MLEAVENLVDRGFAGVLCRRCWSSENPQDSCHGRAEKEIARQLPRCRRALDGQTDVSHGASTKYEARNAPDHSGSVGSGSEAVFTRCPVGDGESADDGSRMAGGNRVDADAGFP